jgi:hypothetical protein
MPSNNGSDGFTLEILPFNHIDGKSECFPGRSGAMIVQQNRQNSNMICGQGRAGTACVRGAGIFTGW